VYVDYHKGGLCVHRPMICQEVYCSDCGIHIKEKIENDSRVNMGMRLIKPKTKKK
jgi:hypothetical protein